MKREDYLKKLKKYDDKYFNNGKPLVVDTVYDKLRREFKSKFPNDPYFRSVGATVKYEKITLPFVMGGLDKLRIDTVRSWLKNGKEIVVSEKLDGNSIACTWVDGVLTFAASRGTDGEGQNILRKAPFFLPKMPIKKGKITLRGETFLEGDVHKKLNYQNRRNATTGILRKDEIKPEVLKQVSVVFYEVIESPEKMNLEEERMSFIQNTLKFRTPEWMVMKPKNTIVDDLCELLATYKERANYDVDGLVLTINNSVRENVTLPKNKVSFKVNESAVECTVNQIEWNVTRLGYVKPVILIKPTAMGGVTVSRVSGFNYDYIETEGIGEGAKVGVVRSGDVIPYVTEVFKKGNVVIPCKCPSCKSKLRKTDKEIICDNENCVQKKIYNVSHFFKTIGANFITDRTIEMMGITSVEEAYNLKVSDLEKREGIGRKKAELLVNEIEKTLHIKPEKLLDAFGMPMIGTRLSKTLCSNFTIDELFAIKKPKLLGIGEVASEALVDNIGRYKSLYKFLLKKGLKFIKENGKMKTLKGLKFALTGAGPLKRKDYEEMAEAKGAAVKSMSKDTNYLVTDDVTSGSAKLKAAEKFGTKIISYTEFEKMLR